MTRFILLSIFIGMGSFVVSAQLNTERATAGESQAVNEIARLFSERFRETHDVEPLINELFVTDFIERSLKEDSREWMMFVDLKLARKLPKRELRRFYVAMTNTFYLYSLYGFSKHSSLDSSDIAERDLLPPEIVTVFENDEFLRPILGDDDDVTPEQEAELFIDTRNKFRQRAETFEAVVRVIRPAVRTSKAGSTPQWLETMKDFGTRFKYYQPWVSECSTECFGYPKGTRIYSVNAELYQLSIVKVNEKMKILSAYYYFD